EAAAEAAVDRGPGSSALIGANEVAALEAEAREPGFFEELKEGWRFLRGEPVLLANTLQATFGQFMIGILLALMPVYARDVIHGPTFDSTAIYSFMEGAIGAGNLLGGFVIGLIGSRLALGRMVIVGYVATGLTVAALALTGNLYVAIGLSFGTGV